MSYGEIFNISRAFTKAFASVLHGGFYICPAVTKAITSVLQTGFHICIAVTEAFAPVTDFQQKKKICRTVTQRLHLYYGEVFTSVLQPQKRVPLYHRGFTSVQQQSQRRLHLYNREVSTSV